MWVPQRKRYVFYRMMCEIFQTLSQLLPMNMSTTFPVGHNANDMLDDLALKAKGSYDMSPTTMLKVDPCSCPSFAQSVLVRFI
jgi:hypothetical protein